MSQNVAGAEAQTCEPLLIALIGAECTGKTTLARALAAHFSGLWVPEYLRIFCDLHQRTPRREEQAQVMRVQLEQQAQVLARARALGCDTIFCDTVPLLTAVYSDYYFADTSLHASAHAVHGFYALNVLLMPDLPWQSDGLQRQGQDAQSAVHAKLVHELHIKGYAQVAVSGLAQDRLQAAILAVQSLSRKTIT